MRSKTFAIHVEGDLACFTRPEFKVERVSYEVMTPSAARGVFESILWKPAIYWHIHKIIVLNPIEWTSFRRNEVKSKASLRAGPISIEDARTQRNTVALRNVSYIVEGSFSMTTKAGERDSIRKFEEMFERRLANGQHFHQPYLGCREFIAEVRPAPESYTPAYQGIDRPLGTMLYDIEYGIHFNDGRENRAVFFNPRLTDGVIHVPPAADVGLQLPTVLR